MAEEAQLNHSTERCKGSSHIKYVEFMVESHTDHLKQKDRSL
ncbi:hypothetical protein HMPREF1870_00426 [Bacteroidales bacterium KA00344]|nr:hypothetical protein HMPREF1870_00426 [Bacteroidales bacterium KA00344]